MERACQTCGSLFRPRASQVLKGQGRFCSQRCNTAVRAAAHTPEARAKSAATYKASLAAGKFVRPVGPDNPLWLGGPKAMYERHQAAGILRERVKAYRRRNPDKVREFAQSRARRKFGRLPKGTVRAIGDLQGWKCAICRASIVKNYHVDHIVPLAKGGLHERRNIQLLCPTCNVRKSAKDPISYMQELGCLL